MTKRSQFVTKTGVIAATVGSAVGLGNIWRFPYEAGVHGGGAFLLLYIVCIFVIGIPVMLSEFVLGRATHQNGVGAFRKLAPKSPFRIVAYMGIIASVMILSFYSVVAGWIMEYLFQSIEGLFWNVDAEQYAERFAAFISNPWRPALWTLIFLAMNFLVLRRGVEKGIEKISNTLMPVLFILLVIFCANSLSLPWAMEGVKFLFTPHFEELSASVVIGAMGQAFFSLSLGLTCMLTYASYFSDSTKLTQSAVLTAILDSLVAILAGLVIFPAVFSFGKTPEEGPKLVFEVLPSIFAEMTGGHIWSVAFFLLLFFASLTSTISMSEIFISYLVEERHMQRQKASIMNTVVCAVLGVLCALSFGPLSEFTICGKNIFDLFDYVASNIFLPCGGILLSLFAGWVLDRAIMRNQLTNDGSLSARWVKPLRFCMRFIAPIAICIVFIYGLM
ncbi:MAG: sodium-dependent transporter [Bacteroidales bacterium]|nr:sodium-dependent transporter [Bacteroidales bacterium]